QQVMSPADFQAHLAWPGDRPHSGEGMDVCADDDEADEAAANAFVDEEDDGDGSD
ncbi:hypothetical protein A2U01_0103803, partial [Trifolium medium]|nr:hypothetical protein [Trifolium medium]